MRYLLLMAGIVIADQLTKLLTRLYIMPGEYISVIGDVGRLTYVENTGAAFGSLSDHRLLLLITPTIIVVAVASYAFAKKDLSLKVRICLFMMAAGGFSNLLDRAILGYVTDMISINFFPPVFNVADSFVTIAVFLLLLFVLFGKDGKSTRRR